MDSWENKTQVTSMLTQTQGRKKIRPKLRNEILIPKKQLQAQRRTRNNSIKEKASRRRADPDAEAEYIKTKEQTEIMQLVEKTPRNAGRIGTEQRKWEETGRTDAGISDEDRRKRRRPERTGATPTLHMHPV